MFNKKPISSTALSVGKSEWGNQSGGASYKPVFDVSKVGDGKLEKYKVREGKNLIDVIPFNAGPSHPLVATGQCQAGDTMYSLDYTVHKSIGPGKQDFVCLRQFKKNCPCCDESQRLYNLGTEDSKKQATAVRSKRRCVYIVHDLIDGKYYYLDQAWFGFEKHINERAAITTDPATGAPVNPFDWENGKSISFYASKDKWNGNEFNKISESAFGFEDRAPLSDEVLSHSVDLSPGLIVSTEDEMDQALCGKPVVSQAKTETPAQTSQPVQSAPSFDTMQTVSQAQPSPTSGNPVPQTETVAQNLAAQAMEAAQAPAAQTSGNVCPHGYNWGDADKSPEPPECATCPLWDKCIDG